MKKNKIEYRFYFSRYKISITNFTYFYHEKKKTKLTIKN